MSLLLISSSVGIKKSTTEVGEEGEVTEIDRGVINSNTGFSELFTDYLCQEGIQLRKDI